MAPAASTKPPCNHPARFDPPASHHGNHLPRLCGDHPVGFLPNTASDLTTSFGLTPGGLKRGAVDNWVVNSQLTLILISIVTVLLGIYQLVRGFGKRTNAILGLVALMFVFAFLTYAAKGNRSISAA